MDRFEYQVCQVQLSRVTFVNGAWIGTVAQTDADAQRALDSCPQVWDYLDRVGADGWKLVSVTTRVEDGGQVVDVLYLRRP